MICIKFHQKNKQPKNPKFCTAEVFRVFTSRCYAERGYETVCLVQREHPKNCGGIGVGSGAQKPAISPKRCKI